MTKAQLVEVPNINVQQMELLLIGDSSLISHKWSDKARKQMLDKQMKKADKGRQAKNPEEDYENSLYRLPNGGGCGFPAAAFKAAAVGACRFVPSIKMTEARGAFHVNGDLVPIDGEPEPREDMVRLARGVADIRYRGQFPSWKCTLSISYNADILSVEQIVNLFNIAGFGVGVGEWRPEKDGSYGRFHVATEKEV